jgi:hypothetical protein
MSRLFEGFDMRRFLAAAVALAPLCMALAAHADDTITSGQTGPVSTGAQGNVTINSGGSVAPGNFTSPPASCATNPSNVTTNPTSTTPITVACTQVAVVLNGSNTNVNNSGTIGSSSVAKTGGATGVLIIGGSSGQISNSSTIVLQDGYTPPNQTTTGLVYGQWSNVTTPQNNYGIRLIAPDGGGNPDFVGSINVTSTGAITVNGNNSYGISIEAPIVADGSLAEATLNGSGSGQPRVIAIGVDGPITVTGNYAVGLNIAGLAGAGPAVSGAKTAGNPNGTGDVWIRSSITATGIGAIGYLQTGDINGRLTIGGAISATGYHYTTRPIDSTITLFNQGPYTQGGVNTETLQGGPAVVVAANVTGGLLLDAQPTTTTTTTTSSSGTTTTSTGTSSGTSTDQDLNGINDADQTTGSITVYGGAPALLIGSKTQSVTLGVVGTTQPAAVAQYDYGMILKGAISANGVYDYVPGTAIQLGVAGGQPVTIAGGGLFSSSTVSATAYQATATAIMVNPGVSMPGDATYNSTTAVNSGITNNGGTISATALGSGVNSLFSDEAKQLAVAIDIESGANVPAINNSGVISASIDGAYGSAIAIVAKNAGPLTVNNTGVIETVVDNTPGTTPQDESPVANYQGTGYCNYTAAVTSINGGNACAVAIDARATTGLTIVQSSGGVSGPAIVGDVYFPDSNFAATPSATYAPGAMPQSSFVVNAGEVVGTINFGNGAVNAFIGQNAVVAGPLMQDPNITSAAQSNLNIEVQGILKNGAGKASLGAKPKALYLNKLQVDQGGTIYAALDPQASKTGYYAQTATIQSGAALGVSFVNLVNKNTTTVLNFVTADNLTVGAIQNNIVKPFMYSVAVGVANPTPNSGLSQIAGCATNQVCVQVTESTPSTLNQTQQVFYNSFYAGLGAPGSDADLRDLFLGETTQTDFVRNYNQLMPVPAGATLLSLASGTREVSRAIADSRPMADPGETTGWTQEINYYADHGADGGIGFRTHGTGVASGIERGTPFGAFGVSLAFSSGDMKTPDQIGASDLGATDYEVGGYWRYAFGGFRAWARADAGYATFNSTRDFIDNPTVPLTQESTTTTTTTDPTTGKTTSTQTVNINSTSALTRTATGNWNGYTLGAAGGLSWEKHFLQRYYVKPEVSVEYYYLNESGYTENNASGGVNGIPLIVGGNAGHMLTTAAMIDLGARYGDVTGQGGLTAELQFGYRDNIEADTGALNVAFVSSQSTRALLAGDSLTGGGPVIGFRIMAGGPMGYVALEGNAEELAAYTEYVLMIRAAYRF